MKEVAEQANVSLSTVSYVLNNSGPVAADRRARVLAAVRELRYTPNEAARRLKRRSALAIGLFVPDLVNQFFALLAQGVERAASERDVLVVLSAPEGNDEAESRNARLLRSQRVDGVIYLSGTAASTSSLLELISLGPVVLVDERRPGLDLPAVLSDGRRGAREIARYVLEQGHERVSVIAGPASSWTAEQRLAGYREAFAALGHDPDQLVVFTGDYRQGSGRELAAQALDGPAGKRPTALLCANDLMAVGAVEYCRAAGLRVPEDVSIVGFDDIPVAALLTPRLTTVSQPAFEMGYRATTILLDRIKEGTSFHSDEFLPVVLQIRDSVAPPAR
ncbi:MAG TPA: LacI family DNA-binding transcriptional regulator [Candidatus Binataceae bacterium]|nr:LacI family DNA-binding transcriptional regulator [Candidatus Binataceae bacterium]